MKEKIKTLLLTIFIILSLLLGGYITYDKLLVNDKKETDNDMDIFKLETIYNTLGIDKNETMSYNHCLNQAISKEDYQTNSEEIFSLYTMINHFDISPYDIPENERNNIMYCDVVKSENCSSPQPFFAAAAARIISKPKATQIISKYNLQNTEFLMEFPYHIPNCKDDIYSYYSTYASARSCEYIVKHDLDIQNQENEDIIVLDNQTVIKLEYTDEGTWTEGSKINQTVKYYLKNNNNIDYSLEKVEVK